MSAVKSILKKFPVSLHSLSDLFDMKASSFRSTVHRNSLMEHKNEILFAAMIRIISQSPEAHEEILHQRETKNKNAVNKFVDEELMEANRKLYIAERSYEKWHNEGIKQARILNISNHLIDKMPDEQLQNEYFDMWIDVLKNQALVKLNAKHFKKGIKLKNRLAELNATIDTLNQWKKTFNV